MSADLHAFLSHELSAATRPEITEAARIIGARLNGIAVLFYGSVLRTGDLDGMLDFYVLTGRPAHRGIRGLASRWLWPDISFEEVRIGERRLRAKVATMPLETFRAAASGRLLDTTIWTRFVQPSALVWTANQDVRDGVVSAVGAAAVTASCFAAVVGPRAAEPLTFWKSLFRQTYEAELRVEPPGREDQILGYAPQRYATLLRLAWDAGGVRYSDTGGVLRPLLSRQACAALAEGWMIRQRMGRLLNAARLIKAAFLLEGAARYAVWKIQRHTGVHIRLTPWREHHPVAAAPGVLWEVWRLRGRTQ